MKTLNASVLMLGLATSSALAEDYLSTMSFDDALFNLKVETGKMQTFAPVAVDWVFTVKTMGKDCDMPVNGKQLHAYIVQMAQHSAVFGPWFERTMNAMEGSRPGTVMRNMLDFWSVMEREDKPRACTEVKALWGDYGSQFPGVFTTDD